MGTNSAPIAFDSTVIILKYHTAPLNHFVTMSDSSDDEDDTRRSDVDNNESDDNRKTSLLLDEVPPAKNVGRKRTIDESALNPDESRKLETRRAYNRQCAAKGMLLLISHGGQ